MLLKLAIEVWLEVLSEELPLAVLNEEVVAVAANPSGSAR
jgi:hypothetical protein